MFDDIVIVPVEMSNEDLMLIVEISKKLGLSRNETIRTLIRLGFKNLVGGEMKVEGEEKTKKGGDKK